MAKAFGIINTSGNHIWVEGMQDYRPIGAFSFLGRYRVIDFPMSNFSNSDIGADHSFLYLPFRRLRNRFRSPLFYIRCLTQTCITPSALSF